MPCTIKKASLIGRCSDVGFCKTYSTRKVGCLRLNQPGSDAGVGPANSRYQKNVVAWQRTFVKGQRERLTDFALPFAVEVSLFLVLEKEIAVNRKHVALP